MDMDFKSFVGGCLGGFAGIITSYPFDTIKVRIQNQKISNGSYSGSIDCFKQILRNESFNALYKGISSPLIGSMFINAILFGVEENVRKYLHLNDSKLSNANKNSFEFYKMYAISGAIAGFTQAFLLSPVELVKIKMQLPSHSNQYKNTWLCARSILEKGGIKGLMRGTNLTLLRDVPAITLYFVCFEYICNFHTKQKDDLSVSHLLLAGGLSGCLSWLLTYPIDVIKTRYQAESSYSSIRDCLRKTVKSEGYMGLWRGLNPTLFRAFPNNAAVFATVHVFNRITTRVQNNDFTHQYDSSTDENLTRRFLSDPYDIHR